MTLENFARALTLSREHAASHSLEVGARRVSVDPSQR